MNAELKPERARALFYVLSAGVVIVLVWGWFLLECFTDLRIVRLGQTARPEPLPIAIPIAVMPVVIVVAVIMWRRAVGIAENGVPMSGIVKSVGVGYGNYRDVSFDYLFEGVNYSKKVSVATPAADKLAPGSKLPIVVDRRNPKRIMVK